MRYMSNRSGILKKNLSGEAEYLSFVPSALPPNPAMKLLSYLEMNPIIEIRKTAADLDASFNTISDAINRLCKIGILKKTANAKRNRTFAYEAYLEILRSGT